MRVVQETVFFVASILNLTDRPILNQVFEDKISPLAHGSKAYLKPFSQNSSCFCLIVTKPSFEVVSGLSALPLRGYITTITENNANGRQ